MAALPCMYAREDWWDLLESVSYLVGHLGHGNDFWPVRALLENFYHTNFELCEVCKAIIKRH